MDKPLVAGNLNVILDMFSHDSEDETSSDEDEIVNLLRTTPSRIAKIKHFVEVTVGSYSEFTFQNHFRMNRSTVYNLIECLERSDFVSAYKGIGKIGSEKAMLLTLWYLNNMETFRQVSDRFDVSMSSAHKILSSMIQYILTLTNSYIKVPKQEDYNLISAEFEKKDGIKNVLGAINGTHIHIKKPQNDAISYLNRKSYYSVILQGVCNNSKLFTDVYCGEPGSLHDARVLRRSSLFKKAENDNIFNNCKILGDSTYPSLPWLVTPYKDNGALTELQKQFNYNHSSTRMVIEHTFSLLKGRFRRLLYMFNLDVKLIVNIILAACVLHNICILQKDTTEIEEIEETQDVAQETE